MLVAYLTYKENIVTALNPSGPNIEGCINSSLILLSHWNLTINAKKNRARANSTKFAVFYCCTVVKKNIFLRLFCKKISRVCSFYLPKTNT